MCFVLFCFVLFCFVGKVDGSSDFMGALPESKGSFVLNMRKTGGKAV